MAGSSLLALIDDIATLLEDVSALTKVAAKKTAGVLGDDLALNAQQVSGIAPERELKVVWAVAKGSLLNKAILVPLALAISTFAPWGVIPLLMVGGAYLCYEGFDKIADKVASTPEEETEHHRQLLEAVADPDLVEFERQQIKGAVRTDFVLSAEIIAISLGTVAGEDFQTRVTVLVAIASIMTVGVYGLVGGIVKLDDLGQHLYERTSRVSRAIGAGLLRAAPLLMKFLAVAGTAAMFLVGGGILTHGIPPVHRLIEDTAARTADLPAGAVLEHVTAMALDGLFGVVAGAVVLALVAGGKRLFRRSS